MNSLDKHILEINLLYKKMHETKNIVQKTLIEKRIRELEDELLEYCSWRKLDYEKVYSKVVK